MSVLNVTPMIAVADIDATSGVLCDCLGSEQSFRVEGYAYMRHAAGGIRVIEAPEEADMDDPARQVIVSIDTDDVDAYVVRPRAALEDLPEGRMCPPFDQPYQQREFLAIHGPVLFMADQDVRPR
ncbi:hypothetical protein [Litorisediminicola beolgyonensis]|uniref:Uncharacterized protein n=1 Tax=Litorisediminicola beolgyonensis TaxID=1173614 RepID=A0ABW3ZDJ0_9RHOB